MSNVMKRPALAGFLVLLLCGAGIWVGAYFLETGNKTYRAAQKKEPVPAAATAPGAVSAQHGPDQAPNAPRADQDSDSTGDDRISEIIANPNLDFPSAVNRLLEILPGLNEAEQEEAAQHIANLSDEKSAAQWSSMLVANQLPAPAAEVLFNDLLNRPQELNMPVLASMADQSVHPKNKDSVEILETLYGPPPQGTTWSAWVKAKLAEEPR